MMYHPIKFGCKKISSSVDMVEKVISDYVSSHCDREPEDSKSVFLQWHSGSWWLITIPCLVTKGSAVEEISSRWTFTGILNLTLTLTLTTTEQSNLFTRHSSLWWVIELVSWYFEPSQPQRIMSGLNTNFSICKLLISQVIIPQVMFFLAYLYSTGTQHIQQDDLFYSAGLHRNRC